MSELDRSNVVALVEQLSRLYLAREMSGNAFSRMAESIIALSGLEETDSELEEFATRLASYSPVGGEGLLDDRELRLLVERKLARLP